MPALVEGPPDLVVELLLVPGSRGLRVALLDVGGLLEVLSGLGLVGALLGVDLLKCDRLRSRGLVLRDCRSEPFKGLPV